jgi:hypothetical protein
MKKSLRPLAITQTILLLAFIITLSLFISVLLDSKFISLSEPYFDAISNTTGDANQKAVENFLTFLRTDYPAVIPYLLTSVTSLFISWILSIVTVILAANKTYRSTLLIFASIFHIIGVFAPISLILYFVYIIIYRKNPDSSSINNTTINVNNTTSVISPKVPEKSTLVDTKEVVNESNTLTLVSSQKNSAIDKNATSNQHTNFVHDDSQLAVIENRSADKENTEHKMIYSPTTLPEAKDSSNKNIDVEKNTPAISQEKNKTDDVKNKENEIVISPSAANTNEAAVVSKKELETILTAPKKQSPASTTILSKEKAEPKLMPVQKAEPSKDKALAKEDNKKISKTAAPKKIDKTLSNSKKETKVPKTKEAASKQDKAKNSNTKKSEVTSKKTNKANQKPAIKTPVKKISKPQPKAVKASSTSKPKKK